MVSMVTSDIRKWNVHQEAAVNEAERVSDPREDDKALNAFSEQVGRMNVCNLFCYRSQCTSGPFAGRLVAVIESELLSRAQGADCHEELRDAMNQGIYANDPQLSTLINNIRQLVMPNTIDIRMWKMPLRLIEGRSKRVFDPREDEAALNDFEQNVPNMSVDNLFCYRSQCTSGPFAGRLVAIIESNLLLQTQILERRNSLLNAMDNEFFEKDPQLSALITKMRSLMRKRHQRICDKLKNNVPMDRMTAGAACVMAGISLIFLGLQNKAVAGSTGNSAQNADGDYQILAGSGLLVAPLVHAVYCGW